MIDSGWAKRESKTTEMEKKNMLRYMSMPIYQIILIKSIPSAGHDRSDGGLITAIMEMAFAGNQGVALSLSLSLSPDQMSSDVFYESFMSGLFSEELGLYFLFSIFYFSAKF